MQVVSATRGQKKKSKKDNEPIHIHLVETSRRKLAEYTNTFARRNKHKKKQKVDKMAASGHIVLRVAIKVVKWLSFTENARFYC